MENLAISRDLEVHSLPVKITRYFTVPLLNMLPEKVIKSMMKKSSRDAATVVAKGGTTHALEAMYTRFQRKLFSRGLFQGLADSFWHHVISQPKALRNRLKIVKYMLHEKILELANTYGRKEVSILSIAGGSSRSIINTLDAFKKSNLNIPIHVVTVDKDQTALDVGKKIAKEYSLEDNFTWMNANAKDIDKLFPNQKFDVVEIVGLLDYFDFERATRLISFSRDLLNENGFIIIANVIPNSEEPFVYKTGWPHMYYRSVGEMKEIFEKSGFGHSNDIIIEPMGVHCVGVAQKK